MPFDEAGLRSPMRRIERRASRNAGSTVSSTDTAHDTANASSTVTKAVSSYETAKARVSSELQCSSRMPPRVSPRYIADACASGWSRLTDQTHTFRIAWAVLAKGRAFELTRTDCERTRQNGGSVFRARANTGDPNGPIEACPLMRTHAR